MRMKQMMLMSFLLMCVGCVFGGGVIVNSIGMEFRRVKGGTFMMGSPPEEKGRNKDEQQHWVSISRNYYMGVHEVTQRQYKMVMGLSPSYFKFTKTTPVTQEDGSRSQIYAGDIGRKPVESVTYYDALAFCQELSDMRTEKAAGRKYRLPTEAEWEHACRRWTRTRFFWGDELDKSFEYTHQDVQDGIAWRGPREVGSKKPNWCGLYDMIDNVSEWCSDWYGPYPEGQVTDPEGPLRGDKKVVKGGSWKLGWEGRRCAVRSATKSRLRTDCIGFRVVLVTEK